MEGCVGIRMYTYAPCMHVGMPACAGLTSIQCQMIAWKRPCGRMQRSKKQSWSELLSAIIFHVCEQRKFWRVCAYSFEYTLLADAISKEITCTGSLCFIILVLCKYLVLTEIRISHARSQWNRLCFWLVEILSKSDRSVYFRFFFQYHCLRSSVIPFYGYTHALT